MFKEIIDMVGEARNYKKSVNFAIDSVKEYGPELKDIASGLCLGIADINIQTIKYYEENGLTRDQAIALVIKDMQNLQKATNNKGSSNKE